LIANNYFCQKAGKLELKRTLKSIFSKFIKTLKSGLKSIRKMAGVLIIDSKRTKGASVLQAFQSVYWFFVCLLKTKIKGCSSLKNR